MIVQPLFTGVRLGVTLYIGCQQCFLSTFEISTMIGYFTIMYGSASMAHNMWNVQELVDIDKMLVPEMKHSWRTVAIFRRNYA